MKLHHFIRKLLLTSLGFTLTLHSSFGSGILSSSLLRRTSPSATTYVAQAARLNSVRVYNTLPDGLKLIELSQKGLAPWEDKKQTKNPESFKGIDITKFCADPERGILYRYQRSKNKSSDEQEEKFPLFKKNVETFDRCSEKAELSEIYQSMGLVESYYDLGDDKSITTAGTGFLVRPDTILTAAHNLTLDPKDSDKIKIKSEMKADLVKFFLNHDDGKSSRVLTVSKYKVPKEWEIGRDKSYDFAVLFLENSITAPMVKLSTILEKMSLPIPACVAGYPDEIPSTTGVIVKNDPLCSYAHSGELKEVSTCRKIIGYDCFTHEGMSGGPVLIKGLPISIGVHTRGGLDLNRGVHHSSHMEAYLQKWFDERENTKNNVESKIIELISELSRNTQEEEYLLSKIGTLKEYSEENYRAYMAVLLNAYRN
jgi:V8-like Glu-specific endopeptidase